MFDQTIEEMTATVFVEPGLFEQLSSSTCAVICPETLVAGGNRLTFADARAVIERADRMGKSAPKHLHNKIRAFRNGVVNAFGPEMVDLYGFAS